MIKSHINNAEKLTEIKQDKLDQKIIQDRSRNPKYTPLDELGKYSKNRKK